MTGEQSSEAAGRLTRLIDISRALMSTHEVDEVVSLILETGSELFDAEGCSLAIADRAAGELSFVAMEGAAKTAPFRVPLGQGIAGHVLKTGRPEVVGDVAADPRFDKTVDRRTGFRTRAIACVPIAQQGRVRGVMQVLNWRRAGGLEPADTDLLSALAGLAGAALSRTRDEDRLRNTSELLRQERDERHQLVPSRNPAMMEVLRTARTAAKSNATVLLLGESGTGKELVARLIHQRSARRDGPFIAINCVALTPTLLESELFGYEKGAFTGATARRKGRFELAEGGSLFLDEIGDLPGELQTKLLRVLQEREFERVGGHETIASDVRVIAATNKDLRAAIETREFREDLYYRLNVVTVSIPPLRQRREDIPGLATHFLMRACQATKRPSMKLSDEAVRRLADYGWPGNVRELANVMERLAVLTEGEEVTTVDLPSEIHVSNAGGQRPAPTSTTQPLAERVLAFKKGAVLEALRQAEDNQRQAAKLLGVAPSNLSRLLKTLGLR